MVSQPRAEIRAAILFQANFLNRRNMNALTAEFLGTMLLILMGGGVVANVVLKGTKGNGGGWIVITTAWELGVFIGVTVAGPYSGAHLNPAVSIALAIAGKFAWAKLCPTSGRKCWALLPEHS